MRQIDSKTGMYSCKSISSLVFTLGKAIFSRSVKHHCITIFAMELEYVLITFEMAKEAVRLRKFLLDLKLIHSSSHPITLYYDSTMEL